MNKKKKIVIIAAVCLCVGIAAGVFVFNFLRKPDVKNVPLVDVPETVFVDSATEPTSQPNADPADTLGEPKTEDGIMLFGTAYHTVTRSSAETYTDAQGIVTPAESITEYYGKDGKTLLFKGIMQKGVLSLYNAKDILLYRTGSSIPDADFEGDPLCWLYKDGKAVLGEQTFFDEKTSQSGVAYYDADGNLLVSRLDICSIDKNDQVVTEYIWRNNTGTVISKADFDALLPEVDMPEFLYIRWG